MFDKSQKKSRKEPLSKTDKRKTRKVIQKKAVKPKFRKVDLARLFEPTYYTQQDMSNLFGDSAVTNFPNYLSQRSAPSAHFAKRFFCSTCGFYAKYACTRCGLRNCSLKCVEIHKQTRCIKFAD